MKNLIYVASSWRNPRQASVVAALRKDHGLHAVYDYRQPAPGNDGFHWSEIDSAWKDWSGAHLSKALDHPIAESGFKSDMDALQAATAVVLVLPCGRSAHLELGYATGAGKMTLVYWPKDVGPSNGGEPELMYRMCDYLVDDLDDVRRILTRKRPAPRWQSDLAAWDARKPLLRNDGPVECRPYHHRLCLHCRSCWRCNGCKCFPLDVKGLST